VEVIVAPHAGFCFGVERAVKIAREAPKPVATLGKLIHNPQVVEQLAREGIYPVASLEEVRHGRVIIRSHGAPPEVLARARELGLKIIDATCPYVARAQRLASTLAAKGYEVVIFGDPSHPEVQGLKGWARDKGVVVSSREEALSLPHRPKRALISQTTQPEEKLEEIAAILKEESGELRVYNTLCRTTHQRQKAALELALQVDVMVVVGGRESANTRHLVEICRSTGTPTYHIETAGELQSCWFKNTRRVGITAGASTPAWIIEEVVVMLSEQEKKDIHQEGEEEQASALVSAEVEAPTSSDGGIESHPLPRLRRGKILSGVVVQITDNEVLVDIGGKGEGVIPLEELSHRKITDPREVVSVGDTIQVMVLRPEDEEGRPILSKRRADRIEAWNKLEEALANGTEVQGEVIEVVKGGLLVDVGVRGFVPASLLEMSYVPDLSPYVGKTLRLKVVELDRSKNKVILSHRAVLEEDLARQREATWASLEKGQVRKGIVRRLTNFGAFVDLGGVDGLLHISEISWGRIDHPGEALEENQEIEVVVLDVNREEGRISLGRKQLLPNPWDTAAERYPVGSIVQGKVLRLAPFGVFVEVEPGIEGLIHISQLADRHVERCEEVVQPGDVIPVKVLGVDPEAQRMSLSLRQALKEKSKRENRQPARREEEEETNSGATVTLGELFGDLLEETKEKL